jgi:hypothetical protein
LIVVRGIIPQTYFRPIFNKNNDFTNCFSQ